MTITARLIRNHTPLATRYIALLTVLILSACSSNPDRVDEPAIVSHHQVDTMSDIMQRITELSASLPSGELLVIFDLDNTLLAMRSDLGSDQWYGWQKGLDNCDPGKVNRLLQVQGALYHAGAMQLTDPLIVDVMGMLHAQDIDAMVLTARGHEFRLPTFRELRRQSILFDDMAPIPSINGLFKLGDKDRDVLYEDGVLMVAGQHKGRMLAGLLQKSGQPWPSHVVFVDDKQYNVDNMAETLNEYGVDSDVYHFTGEQDRIDRFDDAAVRNDWDAALPALQTLESVFSTHNFDLPDSLSLDRSDCP